MTTDPAKGCTAMTDRTILIVDDSPMDLLVAQGLVEKFGG